MQGLQDLVGHVEAIIHVRCKNIDLEHGRINAFIRLVLPGVNRLMDISQLPNQEFLLFGKIAVEVGINRNGRNRRRQLILNGLGVGKDVLLRGHTDVTGSLR